MCENCSTEIQSESVFIIDGLAMIQQLDPMKLQGPSTFSHLVFVILKCLVGMANGVSAKSIYFVTDTYPEKCIKNAERKKRAATVVQRFKEYVQTLLKQWKIYLSCGANKEELIVYMFETWQTHRSTNFNSIRVYLVTQCHLLPALIMIFV